MAQGDKWKGKKKMAVYLRRSEGETGNTDAQLKRILPTIAQLEKRGKINKVNRTVVGRDINRKRRFDRTKDLAIKGDIFNEGEGASGFGFERPVLDLLVEKLNAGEYDGILIESMDRIARDWTGLVDAIGASLWRAKGKVFLSLSDGEYLDKDPTSEAIINTRMTWGGIAKKGEIDKAEKERTGTTVDRGFFKSSAPEFLGTKGKAHGLDYRKAWGLMKAYGEIFSKRANRMVLAKPGDIGEVFGKDNKWASSWYARLKAYDELGVLEAWLDAYDAVNNYTKALGGYPRSQWKSNEGLARIRYATSGFFGYPAGVRLAGTDEFIIFPNPLEVGLENLASVDDARSLDGFEVIREEVGDRELNPFQTQQQSRKE